MVAALAAAALVFGDAANAAPPQSPTNPGQAPGAPGQAGPGRQRAAENTQSAAGVSPAPLTGDQAFARQMAQAGVAEIQTAQLALKKSHNARVIAFANRMIQDHTKNDQQLTAAAGKTAAPPAIQPSAADAATMQQLQGLNGAAFDRAYMQSQVAAHQRVLALLQTEIANGTDASIKQYAQTTVPVIQTHLRMAQQVATAVGR